MLPLCCRYAKFVSYTRVSYANMQHNGGRPQHDTHPWPEVHAVLSL